MNLESDLYLAPETRCGQYGHTFIAHELLGLACMRCGRPHVCADCAGTGEQRNGQCRSCGGQGCYCGPPGEDHELLIDRLNWRATARCITPRQVSAGQETEPVAGETE